MITLTDTQKAFLKTNVDVLLKSSGSKYLVASTLVLATVEQKEFELTMEVRKSLNLICDVALKSSGLSSLQNVLEILNITAMPEKVKVTAELKKE